MNELVFKSSKGNPVTTSSPEYREECLKSIGNLFGGQFGQVVMDILRPVTPKIIKKTYLATDGSLFKIGRSKDPIKRVLQLKIANPSLSIVCVINEDIENVLHLKYRDKSISNEWFSLDGLDVEYIKSLGHE